MRVLHTSDWHIGRTLYGRKRYDEFEAFLSWLSDTVRETGADVLLVAGDVFDTTAPSNRAQELYYRFLCRVAGSSCRHVVIIAGNHDSPSFLNAPKELLKALNVHVIGSATDAPEDEVLLLCGEQGDPEMIVCAVPYLRDRDIRVAEAGESIEDKDVKLVEGIRSHYSAIAAVAGQKKAASGRDIPVVATGHLFAAGCRTIEGDGVRELYVGSLAHVTSKIIPDGFSYLALGHLHVPQKVSGSETMRYSGSPLPMGFGEAQQQKSVCLVDFEGASASVALIDVPVFQRLERITGDWPALSGRLRALSQSGSRAWVEVIYAGDDVISDLPERINEITGGSQLEVLRIKDNRIVDRVMGQLQEDETLDNLNADEVFARCLDAHEVPDAQRAGLTLAYAEIVSSLFEDDTQAA